MALPEEPSTDYEPNREATSPWQFSLWDLCLLTAIVAVVCGLAVLLGVRPVLAIAGAAAGAFVGALVCP